jgi:hypothetical protein
VRSDETEAALLGSKTWIALGAGAISAAVAAAIAWLIRKRELEPPPSPASPAVADAR